MVALLDAVPRGRAARPVVMVAGLAVAGAALLTGVGLWLVVVGIAVPLMAVLAVRPQVGVLVFAFLLPFDGIIKQFGPGFLDPWKQAFILGLLLLSFVCPPEARAARDREWPSFVPWFLLYLALGLVSVVLVDRTTALVGLRLSYFSALIALTVWRCPLGRRERDHLVSVWLAAGIITALYGIWQQIVGHAYLNGMGYEYNQTIRFASGFTLRSFSTFNLPFSFGFYEMLVILLGLPMALAEPHRLRSRIFFVSLPLLSIALLYSFVRGAMLGLAVGLLYLAFHRYKLLVYGIPIVLVAALLIPSGSQITGAVFSSTSLGERTVSWNDRFDHYAEHPFGTGVGTTGAAAEKAARLKLENSRDTYVPDNTWLKVLFELGVIGLWAFVLMIVSMFLFVRQAERRVVGIDRDFANGVAAQILAMMTASLVATYLELTPMDQLFWLMLGVVAAMAPITKPGPPVVGEAARALGQAG